MEELDDTNSLYFDKHYIDNDYVLAFNTTTGFELLSGVNEKPDPFVLKLPSLLDIGIMGHCANHCEICYQGDDEEDHMELKDFINILDQVKHHTNQIALGGRGDPNKHPEFSEFLMETRRRGIVPNYTTSGNGLTYDEIQLTRTYCGAVAVSNYNKDYTYSAINRFMSVGMKTNIHYVYSRETFEDALRLLKGEDIWKGAIDIDKLNAVIFLLFKKKGRASNMNHLAPTAYQINLLCQAIHSKEANLKFKVGMDSCLVNHYYYFIASLTEEEKLSLDTCEAARMSAYISPSLKMMPCSFCDPTEGISMKDKTIKDIWDNAEPFIKVRDILRKYRACCPARL